MKLAVAKRQLRGYLDQLWVVQQLRKAGQADARDLERAEADVEAMLNAIEQIRRGH